MKRFIAKNREGFMAWRVSGKSSSRQTFGNKHVISGFFAESVCAFEKAKRYHSDRGVSTFDGRFTKLTAHVPY